MAVQFDYTSIKNRIKDRLRQTVEWQDILYYSVNERLIDMFANELEYSMRYDEFLTREAKWNLARNISSLLSQNEFFNYTPHRKQGAVGELKVSTSSTYAGTHPYNVNIPIYTSFSTDDGITFTSYEASVLGTSDNYIDVPIVQGIPKTKTYVASGIIYEEVRIDNTSIENNYYTILVNGEEYTELADIRLAELSTSKVFTIKNLVDWSGVKITFGNDIFGRKLANGDTVTIQYIETLGDKGDVTSSDLITNVDDEITDGNNDIVTLYCTNVEAISGGTTYEDIESIRVKAPRHYTTRDRAISIPDYKSLLEELSYVSKAAVWGETEYNEINGNPPGTYVPLQENVVNLSCLSTTGGNITSAQQDLIRTELNLKKPPTDIIQFSDIDVIYVTFTVDAYISNRAYTENFVRSGIITGLSTRYDIHNMEFKEFIYQSDYICLIDQVEGVNHHYTELSYYKTFDFASAYAATVDLGIEDITTGTVKVYVKLDSGSYDLVATDDGNYPNGGWTFESGYAGSGALSYLTGSANITITSGLTLDYTRYTIKVEFESDAVDLELTLPNQIVSYGSSSITITYM